MSTTSKHSEGSVAHDWAGDAGMRWLAQLDRFEAMLEPIGEALLAQAAYSAGEKVVDIGCGGGWTTQRVAAAIGNTGSAVGLDLSLDLVATASERAARDGLTNIRFIQGDAATAMPAEAPFDRLFSRFGTMFFPDPQRAFTNLHRMLRNGGRLDIALWAPIADNPWQSKVMAVLRQHIDLPTPQPRAPGPFALSEQDYVTDLLRSAGFSDIVFNAWSGDQSIGGPGSDPESATRFVLNGMQIANLFEACGEETQVAIHQSLLDLFEHHRDGDSVRMEAKAWLVSASA